MTRLVKVFAMAGFIVPVALMVLGVAEFYLDPLQMPLSTMYGLYVWPSRTMLLGQDEALSINGMLALGASILVNMGLYIAAALLLALSWKIYRLMRFVARPG